MVVPSGSYTLQTDALQTDYLSVPQECAQGYFPYAAAGRLHYFSRSSNMEFGTAPYMAGKGAPAHLIDVEDQLRPQSTKRFGKVLVEPYARSLFPLQDVHCLGPQRTMSFEPASTRAQMQNGLFQKRYCGTK